jgi:hypothetical protein
LECTLKWQQVLGRRVRWMESVPFLGGGSSSSPPRMGWRARRRQACLALLAGSRVTRLENGNPDERSNGCYIGCASAWTSGCNTCAALHFVSRTQANVPLPEPTYGAPMRGPRRSDDVRAARLRAGTAHAPSTSHARCNMCNASPGQCPHR